MKIVIEIDDNLYTRLFDNGVDNYDDAVDMAKAIRNGTPIPDDATNGDVIKALFPDEHDFETDFDEEWWNSPYQKGGKE